MLRNRADVLYYLGLFSYSYAVFSMVISLIGS